MSDSITPDVLAAAAVDALHVIPDGQTFGVDHRPPALGPAAPLSAAYCAERAAFALVRAETAPPGAEGPYLAAAAQWRRLAVDMATHAPMSRPRDDKDSRR